MFPLGYNNSGMLYPVPFNLTNKGLYNGDLPEEVRETIEDKRNEIESEEDIHDIVEESYYRR